MKPDAARDSSATRPDTDPVIEFYKRSIDRTLLVENLKKTPTERVAALMALQRLADEAHRAGRKAARRE